MKIEGLSDYQCALAELLWSTDSRSEVDSLIETFGVDAIIVHSMIVAEALDGYDEVELAEHYLRRFML